MSNNNLEFAKSVAIYFAVSLITNITLMIFYGLKVQELNRYKAYYNSALNWIKDELPTEQEDELMLEIKKAIEAKK